MSQAHQVVERFKGVHDDVAALAATCTDEQWAEVCPGEEWPIGGVFNHIADAYAETRTWVDSLVAGQDVEVTMDEIHAANFQRADANAAAGRTETLDRLESEAALTAARYEVLTEEQLAITRPFALAGRDLTVAQVAGGVLAHHTKGHLDSIRAALGVPQEPART